MVDNTPDEKRRSILKGIGAAAGATIFGLGSVTASSQETEVSTSQVRKSLEQEEVLAVTDRVGLSTPKIDRATGTEVTLYKNAGVEVSHERWIVIPHENSTEVAYNPEERIAETETESGAIVRATPEDDGLFLEEIHLEDSITNRAVTTIENSSDYDDALKQADVVSTKMEAAAAHRDAISGTTRVFVPAVQTDGSEVMLLVEFDADSGLESVYGLPLDDGLGTNDAFECWAACITVGRFCQYPCSPCLAAPNQMTCAPCAACIGGSAAICAAGCGLSEFW